MGNQRLGQPSFLFQIRDWLSKHICLHRLLYLRLLSIYIIFQWAVLIGQESGWRTQHQSFSKNGYQIGLWQVEYQAALWKHVLFYLGFTAVAAVVVTSPIIIVASIWASTSWTALILGGGALGVAGFLTGGAALLPVFAAVTACVSGAFSMYITCVPKFLHWWKDQGRQIKTGMKGKYYWGEIEAKNWGDEWLTLKIGSVIMFSAGLLIIIAFVVVFVRLCLPSKKDKKDPVVGITLMVAPALAFVAVVQYYFMARNVPKHGYFDWVYWMAVAQCFFSLSPACLEAYTRGSMELWQGEKVLRTRHHSMYGV